MINEFKNKTITVTGGTGTIGSLLVKKLLAFNPKQIRVFSRDDSKQYYLMNELNNPKNLRFFIGDIRDKERLGLAFQGTDMVLHAAALKHVPACEYNPFEAVKTNIIGSQNVIEMALKNKVSKVIAISTDKAVNPTNVMGTSKLMMEKLFITANNYSGRRQTKFACVRFGNIIQARGSVLALWQQQIQQQKPITVTEPGMTRFFMSQEQAIALSLRAAQLSQGGEIFIFKMPAVKLSDLVKLFLDKYYPGQNIKVNIIGARAGEKKHEELFDQQDICKELLEDKELFIIIPYRDVYNLREKRKSYAGFRKARNLKRYSSELRLNVKKIKTII